MHVVRILEVLLFSAHGPVPIPTLIDVLGVSEERLQQAIAMLRSHYSAHGIRVRQNEANVYLDVATMYRKWAQRLHDAGYTGGVAEDHWDDDTLNSIANVQISDLSGLEEADENRVATPETMPTAPSPSAATSAPPTPSPSGSARPPAGAAPQEEAPSMEALRRAVNDALERAARLAKSDK